MIFESIEFKSQMTFGFIRVEDSFDISSVESDSVQFRKWGFIGNLVGILEFFNDGLRSTRGG
jgi:hypothetical protein